MGWLLLAAALTAAPAPDPAQVLVGGGGATAADAAAYLDKLAALRAGCRQVMGGGAYCSVTASAEFRITASPDGTRLQIEKDSTDEGKSDCGGE